jgi:hypothetical protein
MVYKPYNIKLRINTMLPREIEKIIVAKAGKEEVIKCQDEYPELLRDIYIDGDEFWLIHQHNRKYIISLTAPKDMTDSDLDEMIGLIYLDCSNCNFTRYGHLKSNKNN